MTALIVALGTAVKMSFMEADVSRLTHVSVYQLEKLDTKADQFSDEVKSTNFIYAYIDWLLF